MNIIDPHIQSILEMIEHRHVLSITEHEIINEIQLAFEFHLINFYEYEALLVKLLSKEPSVWNCVLQTSRYRHHYPTHPILCFAH